MAWFYRIGIFLAIGTLMFERMPKILGIYVLVMMLVAMVFKPIFMTFWGWIKRYKELNWNRYSISSFAVFGLILLLIFIPWQSSIVIPGVIAPKLHNEIYPGVEGKVVRLPEQGQILKRGELLYVMENPDLEYSLLVQKKTVDYYSLALQRMGSEVLLQNRALDRDRLRTANSEYIRVARNVQRLSAKAPYDGTVVWVDQLAAQGGYVSRDKPLLTYIDSNSNELYGYIGEYDLQRLNQEGAVRFYPEHPYYAPLDGEIIELDTANASVLDYEILSSSTGGPINAKRDELTGKLSPRDPVYLIKMKIKEGERQHYPILLRGRVLLEGERKSYASRFFDSLLGTIIRESGF